MDTSISQPLNVSFFNIFVIVCIHKVAANISLQLNINCPAIINKQCTVVVSHAASFHVRYQCCLTSRSNMSLSFFCMKSYVIVTTRFIFYRVYTMEKQTSFWHLQTLERTLAIFSNIYQTTKMVMTLASFLVLLVLRSNFRGTFDSLLLITNSCVAVFQGHVTCHFYPLEGLM